MRPEDLFARNLPLIERVLTITARRQGSTPDEVEEFRAWAIVRLIDNDYRVLRRYQGRSRLRTFLAIVAANLFRDWRNARWGKWRPSAAARRLGTLAIRVETLVVRDGHSLTAATRMLQINEAHDVSEDDIAEIVGQLPARFPRRPEGDEELERQTVEPTAEERARDAERETALEGVRAGLEKALEGLPAEDRLILRLRYEEGMSVADIARLLEREQKPLYGLCNRHLRAMREAILEQGLSLAQVRDLLGWEGLELSLAAEDEGGDSDPRPSQQAEDD